MSTCRSCGRYNDPFEWPDDQKCDFRPDLCFECFQKEQQQESDESDEIENFDPNTEFGMPEVKPDPEDDDAPDLGEQESELSEELEETIEDTQQNVSDEEQSLRDLSRMLFG